MCVEVCGGVGSNREKRNFWGPCSKVNPAGILGGFCFFLDLGGGFLLFLFLEEGCLPAKRSIFLFNGMEQKKGLPLSVFFCLFLRLCFGRVGGFEVDWRVF